MVMSQRTAAFLLALPPVRGFFSLLFLLMLTAVPLQEAEMGVGARLGLGLVVLMLGSVLWAVTLSGFVRDVREPRRLEKAVVVAHRPRRLARALSWASLVTLVLSGLLIGVLAASEAPDLALAVCALCFLVALPIASLLPRLSRRYADGAGLVAVSPDGLRIVPGRKGRPARIPWTAVGAVRSSSAAATSLAHGPAEELGARVRWRRGAREAVARWAEEGFAPTADEVRALDLDPRWCPDPVRPSAAERWGVIVFQGWAALFCLLLAAALLGSVAVGAAPWWVLLVLGWAPLLGLVILAPRLLRLLRHDDDPPAAVTAEGWVDRLHGQGLVAWQDIERLEVREGHTLLITRADAPRFTDRDLGNRMNHRVGRMLVRSSLRVPSAGPLFREIGPRHLPYPPGTGAAELAAEAERRGRAAVRRS